MPPPPPAEVGASASASPEPPMESGIPEVGSRILQGKYQIDARIGSGGMGVVFSARHIALGKRVAFKFLSPSAAAIPGAAERFLREGRAAVNIEGEQVARVMDVGVLENGVPYLVMERLIGADLKTILRAIGPMQIGDAVDCVMQVCLALAEAHAIGIVHRDLKPSNIFITRAADGSPLVKVLDFGISKIATGLDDTDASLTGPGMMLGSPRYMSPEQVRDARDVDHRSDIWSLGVVLHEILAGDPMFNGESFSALCAAIVADSSVSIRTKREDVPEPLEAIILKCTEKEASDRYQSVAELAQALAPFAGDGGATLASRIARVQVRKNATTTNPTTGALRILPAEVADAVTVTGPSGSGPNKALPSLSASRLGMSVSSTRSTVLLPETPPRRSLRPIIVLACIIAVLAFALAARRVSAPRTEAAAPPPVASERPAEPTVLPTSVVTSPAVSNAPESTASPTPPLTTPSASATASRHGRPPVSGGGKKNAPEKPQTSEADLLIERR